MMYTGTEAGIDGGWIGIPRGRWKDHAYQSDEYRWLHNNNNRQHNHCKTSTRNHMDDFTTMTAITAITATT